ncbi:MAG: septation protein SpoVG family protein [Candidatus Omnitrophota bacterium]|jgi:stage V sporulation protein G
MEDNINVNVERLYKLESVGALKGFADISICNSITVKGLRIVSGKKGLFVSMPQELGKDGKWHNRVIVNSDSLRDKLTELVLSAFQDE